MFESNCHNFLQCLPFLTVAMFYGLSLAFVKSSLRSIYGIAWTALLLLLAMADTGPHFWWSLFAAILTYLLAEVFISPDFREPPLPVDLTSYSLINLLFFLAPFLLAFLLVSDDISVSLALQILILALTPVVWTLFTFIKLLEDRSFKYAKQLLFFWSLYGLVLAGFAIYVFIRFLILL